MLLWVFVDGLRMVLEHAKGTILGIDLGGAEDVFGGKNLEQQWS